MLTHIGSQIIETPRLVLRRSALTDRDAMFRNWASREEVTKYLTWPPYKDLDAVTQRLQLWQDRYQEQAYYHWLIELKELGQPIGSIGSVELDERVCSVEIGYCLGDAWWHQGIMTEALSAVIAFFFDKVGMNRIEAKHDPNNPHSGAVMAKCGMVYEGTMRQCSRNNQGICDLAVYAILKED